MTDIVQKLKDIAPNEIDIFAADMERRSKITDLSIQKTLSKIFTTIDPNKLGNSSLEYSYASLAKKLSV